MASVIQTHATHILSPIFQAYVVGIDYRASAMHLWKADTYVAPESAIAIPIKLHGSRVMSRNSIVEFIT